MSHRTSDLPPSTGLARVVRELRYHEASRQVLAIVLVVVFTLAATPIAELVYVGAPVALLGTLIRLHASGFVMKNKVLATIGPYALVRHPLYTGNLLLVGGFAVASSQWWAVPLSIAFFLFYYPTAIEYEDRKLHQIFGAEWESWSRNTPALVPKLSNANRLFTGHWSFAKSTMQNGEILFVIYSVVCMAWIIWQLNST